MRNLSFIFTILLLATSCAPAHRISTSVVEVYDTTRVVVHDTIHITQVHDSIAFHTVEHIHEQETTTYDPATGNPIQRQLTRDTDRDIDALIRHIADSLFSVHGYEASDVHAETENEVEEDKNGEASLSPLQIFARQAASVVCLSVVLFLIVLAVKTYNDCRRR